MITKIFHYLTITLLLFSVILRPDPGFAAKTFQDDYERKKPTLLQFAQSLGQENPQETVPAPGTSRLRILVNVGKAKITIITKDGIFRGTANFALPYDQPNFPSGSTKLRLEVKGFDPIERDIVVPDRSKVTEIFKFVSLEKTVEVIEEIEKISIPEGPKGAKIKIKIPKEVETTQEVKEEKLKIAEPEKIKPPKKSKVTKTTEHQNIGGSSYLNITIARFSDALSSVVGSMEIFLAAYEEYIILIDDQKIGEFHNAPGTTFNHREPLSRGKHDIEIIYNSYAVGVIPIDKRTYKNTIVIKDNGSDLILVVMNDFKPDEEPDPYE